MPENNLPSAKPDPEVAPGEFDFADPTSERPRVKRRALQDAATKKAEPAPEKTAPVTARPAETAKPAPTRPAASASASAAANLTRTVSSTSPTQASSPHGTRPATLYYTSGPSQSKETTSPMKTTPAASSSSTTAAASTTSASRTTPASSTSSTPATSVRPSSVSDFRANAERQAREQKSVGDILSVIVYTLIGLFLLGGVLSAYGAYTITKQLNQQSVTMSDFDKRYSADYKDINGRLVLTMDNLTQAQAQIAQEQTLISKQQDLITKMQAANDDLASALRQEKATRAQETANIRARIKDIEYTGPTTRKY